MARLTDGAELLECSLRGKSQKQVRKLIGGSGVHIYDECIKLCNEVIEEKLGEKPIETSSAPLSTPREVKESLDSWVVGQDRVKRALFVAVYNHYERVRSYETGNEENMFGTKSNIPPPGPTDTGKTHLARSLARLLHVPFVIIDATILIEAGYVGKDVENTFLRPIQEANGSIKKAKHGIIYVDETGKIGHKDGNASTTRDVSDEDIQQALLRIIGGTVALVPPQGGRRHPHQQLLEIDASRILFIATGAFADIEDIVKVRIGQRSTGFGSDLRLGAEMGDLYEAITPEDLHRFSMIPEFIGRLPVLASTKRLAKGDLVKALTEPKNSSFCQHQYLFEPDGVDLEFTHEVLFAITALANECKTGACGLFSIMERTPSDPMSELPSRGDVARVAIIRECIEGTREPEPYAQRGNDIRSA